MLSDKTIKRLKLLDPLREENLQPASYDLTLDDSCKKKLYPGQSMYGLTVETVKLPKRVAGVVRTKSSLARMGITAGDIGGFVDPGFNGQLTLFVKNLGDEVVDFRELDTFCQIYFFKLDQDPDEAYDGHYQNSRGINESRFKKVPGDPYMQHLVDTLPGF